MANIVKQVEQKFYQYGFGRSANDPAGVASVSCFGLAGSNANPLYCTIDGTLYVGVDENHDVYAKFSGTIYTPVNSSYVAYQPLSASDYTVYFGANYYDFSVENRDCETLATGTVAVPYTVQTSDGKWRGQFTWTFSTDWVYISSFTQCNGTIWFGGSTTYKVTSAVFPEAVSLTIDDWYKLEEYYPWAIRKSGTWMSADRDGGSLKIRKSGSWRDVKNYEDDTAGDSKGFYRSGGSWVKAPEIGAT